VFTKEQMGHSSIQVTVSTYAHLIPGANVSFVDLLDEKTGKEKKEAQQNAPPTQLRSGADSAESA
jgi:hypothetical protein